MIVLPFVGLAALFIGWLRASELALPFLPAARVAKLYIANWHGHAIVGFWGWFYTLPQLGSAELLLCHAWGVLSTLLALALILPRHRSKGPEDERSTRHGSARFAYDWELFSWLHGRLTSDDCGVVLGERASAQLDQEPRSNPPRLRIVRPARWIRSAKRHTLIVGTNGEGKDACVQDPTLLTERSGDSLFVNDPSGETFEKTAGFRALFTRVLSITPTRMGGAGFNPLMTIPRNAHAIGEARRIVTALVGSAEDAKKEGVVYSRAAETLLQAAILDILYHGERKSLPGVWRSILGVEAAPRKRGEPSPQRQWVRVRRDRAPNRHVADVFDELLSFADGVLAGAFNNAGMVLDFCSDPLVADTLDRCDCLPDDLRQYHEPLTVYLCIPERDAARLQGLTRVIIDTVIAGLMTTRKHRRGAIIMMNEFVGMGPLPSAASAFKDIRKYNVQLVPMVQSTTQIERTYPELANDIIGNCHVHQTLGAVDLKSLRQLSVLMGTQTLLEERTTQGSSSRPGQFGRAKSESVSAGEIARPLMTEAELRELDPREALILVAKCKPYIVKRLPYYADKVLLERSQLTPPSTSFRIDHELPWALHAPTGEAA